MITQDDLSMDAVASDMLRVQRNWITSAISAEQAAVSLDPIRILRLAESQYLRNDPPAAVAAPRDEPANRGHFRRSGRPRIRPRRDGKMESPDLLEVALSSTTEPRTPTGSAEGQDGAQNRPGGIP